jgi:Mg/Co/Ni transporter MgtE
MKCVHALIAVDDLAMTAKPHPWIEPLMDKEVVQTWFEFKDAMADGDAVGFVKRLPEERRAKFLQTMRQAKNEYLRSTLQ